MASRKNYRDIYQNYLEVTIPEDWHVHHIDHNRSNNSIENLVALPRSIHAIYHIRSADYTGMINCYGDIKPLPGDDRFNFYHIYTGEFESWFDGTEQEYIDACQRANARETIFSYIEKIRLLLQDSKDKITEYIADQRSKNFNLFPK